MYRFTYKIKKIVEKKTFKQEVKKLFQDGKV
jgi:hypothetical protein